MAPKIHHPGRRDPNDTGCDCPLVLSWSMAITFLLALFLAAFVYFGRCVGENNHESCDSLLGYIMIFGIGAAIMLPVSILYCWCRQG
jgi:Na+-driven multidrug efflux pump